MALDWLSRSFAHEWYRCASVLVAVMLVTMAGVGCQSAPEYHGTFLEPPMEAKSFELMSSEGVVSAEDFAGRLVVLAFGYSHCPDVCPATMDRLARAMDRLDDADQVQTVLVAVDSERDTPERIARYAAGFDTSFVGLSGTPEQIAAVAADYGIHYERVDTDSKAGYLIDHTAAVTVLDRQGRPRLIWSFGITPEEMAADLQYLVDHS